MQYNGGNYNAHQYNVDFWSVALLESIGSTDSIAKDIFIIKTESEPVSDAHIFDGTMHALLELVTSADVRLMKALITEIEAITLTDALNPFSVVKVLTESITSSDTLTRQIESVLPEFLFLESFIKLEVVNKALNDRIRLNDWLDIKKPFVEYWHD